MENRNILDKLCKLKRANIQFKENISENEKVALEHSTLVIGKHNEASLHKDPQLMNNY